MANRRIEVVDAEVKLVGKPKSIQQISGYHMETRFVFFALDRFIRESPMSDDLQSISAISDTGYRITLEKLLNIKKCKIIKVRKA